MKKIIEGQGPLKTISLTLPTIGIMWISGNNIQGRRNSMCKSPEAGTTLDCGWGEKDNVPGAGTK